MATLTKRASGITQTGWTNPTNAYDAGTATFASWASVTANQTNTIYLTGYNFLGAGLPSTAGLNSVTFTVKQYVSAANRMNAPTVRAYLGATPLGTTTTLTNSTQTTNSQTVTITGVAISDLLDSTFQVQLVATHYNGTISGTQFLDYIDVTVDYTPVAAPTSRTLTATSSTSTSVALSWNADTAAFPTPTYTVEQSTNGTTFSTVTSGISGTSYTVTGLTTGVLYYFRIIGTNSQGSATSNTATATPTAWKLENTLEGGTDETAINTSPSLSGPDPFNLFYNNTAAVYETLRAKGGTVSMRTQHTTGTTGSSMAGWTFTGTTRLPFYSRFYFYATAFPSTNTKIIRIGNSADSEISFVNLNSTGTLSVGVGASSTTTTSTISLSSWVRVEVRITSTGATLRLYNSTESTTVTEEVTFASTIAAVGTIRHGVNAVTNAGPFWWDSLKVTDENWIGPESPANIVGYWGIKYK